MVKRSIRQTPETVVRMTYAVDDPSPAPPGPSASEIASQTGDYTAFDRIVDGYVAELRLGGRHRRIKDGAGDTTPRCPDCGHPLTGSVRPGSHGRPCMTVLADTPGRRGIPERCPCEWLPPEGSFQPG